jgi:DNA replication protein DnaC
MLTQNTIETLRHLKLHGMAQALEEQRETPTTHALAFEERLGLLVDRERLHRQNGRYRGLLREARLKSSQACIEDIHYKSSRGLDKSQIASLADGAWIQRGQNLLLTGPTGSGKTWIACALAHQACRQGLSGRYWRVPRLFEEIRTAHGDGSYLKILKRLAKSPVLILDDWGLTALSTQDRADLLEILDDRLNARSTVICSQLPVDTWHAYLGEPTLADAILDRLVHHSHRIELKTDGESLRKTLPPPAAPVTPGASAQGKKRA